MLKFAQLYRTRDINIEVVLAQGILCGQTATSSPTGKRDAAIINIYIHIILKSHICQKKCVFIHFQTEPAFLSLSSLDLNRQLIRQC